MAIIRPRTRLVYFRVSEDEYQQFSQMCKPAGARSISDLARAAVRRAIQEGVSNQEEKVACKLQALDDILTELNAKLERVDLLLDTHANRLKATASLEPAGPNGQEPEERKC